MKRPDRKLLIMKDFCLGFFVCLSFCLTVHYFNGGSENCKNATESIKVNLEFIPTVEKPKQNEEKLKQSEQQPKQNEQQPKQSEQQPIQTTQRKDATQNREVPNRYYPNVR
jgi:hypothetical protein